MGGTVNPTIEIWYTNQKQNNEFCPSSMALISWYLLAPSQQWKHQNIK